MNPPGTNVVKKKTLPYPKEIPFPSVKGFSKNKPEVQLQVQTVPVRPPPKEGGGFRSTIGLDPLIPETIEKKAKYQPQFGLGLAVKG